MSKAVDDILGFIRGEDLGPDAQAELIQRLRDGEGEEHTPAGVWTQYDNRGAMSLVDGPAKVRWVHSTEGFTALGLEITFYHGRDDGKPVIQIDGSADFRINVNDCPVWDQSTEFGYVMPEELREGRANG